MEKEFRLIQAIRSVDNLTNEDIVIFEMTQIQYSYNSNNYIFNPEPSVNNYFFVYQSSDTLVELIMDNRNEIQIMDLNKFELKIIRTPEGIRNTYFSNKLAEKRRKKRNENLPF